jgi:hypothetical protein
MNETNCRDLIQNISDASWISPLKIYFSREWWHSEAGGSWVWAQLKPVSDQSRLHSKTLSQKTKTNKQARDRWFTPVIPAMQEKEVGGLLSYNSPRQIHKTISVKQANKQKTKGLRAWRRWHKTLISIPSTLQVKKIPHVIDRRQRTGQEKIYLTIAKSYNMNACRS